MQSLKGQLLIATPQLITPIFAHSVILMLDHSDEGAMGVIVNQPINTTVTDLAGRIFEEDFEWTKPLHLGGPVAGSLVVLHTREELGDHEIIPGVFITLQARVFSKSFANAWNLRWSSPITPAGTGQLEGEFTRDSWLTLPALPEHVFWPGERELWNVVLSKVNARKLSDFLGLEAFPDDPSLN